MKVPVALFISAAAVIFLLSCRVFGQINYPPEQYYADCFNEVKNAEEQCVALWDMNMYGPVIFVNPLTREVYSNYPDGGGELRRMGNIYYGILPDQINIYNTVARWNGRSWAMIMLPLPGNEKDRINLIAHELFHVAQLSLGFRGYVTDNNHLDDKNGRILVRLELEALRKALESTSSYATRKHLTDAMIFRLYRYSLFPQAKFTENILELNEGLAEYTGVMVAGRTKEETLHHFEVSINSFVRFPTFVRSFAYETVPIYGYLLQEKDKYWNKKITPTTNLTDFFIHEFGLIIPADLPSVEHNIEGYYDGKTIRAEETSRETIRQQQIERYRKEFVGSPHLEIYSERMRIAFDPTNVIPLDDKGNVYPTLRVTDNWGILEAQNGALLSPTWDRVIVSAPTKIDGKQVSGDGWTLRLNDSYVVMEDYSTGNYIVRRR
jgi:hypothetical protein